MTEQSATSNLIVSVIPIQETPAISYIAHTLKHSTDRQNVVMVRSAKDAEDLASKLHKNHNFPTTSIKDFDETDREKSVIYQQPFDKLCIAEEKIKGELIVSGRKEGWRNFSKRHNKLHIDKTCPYYRQNMMLSSLYGKGGFFTLIASIDTMAGWDFDIDIKEQFDFSSKLKLPVEFSFAKHIIIWLKDGYREDKDRYQPTVSGKTQRIKVGSHEWESEDEWGQISKWSIPTTQPKPIHIEYSGKEISGYKRVKDCSFVPIKDAGWVKETESNFILPSKLTLVILNALSQGYHWDIDLISVHADIFKEELELIDGCEFVFPLNEERRPKIKLVKVKIPVNLNAARGRTLTKSLPVLKQFHNVVGKLKEEPIDVAFLHFGLKNLGDIVKSRNKDAIKELEEYADFEKNSQEIKNIRHNYLIGPNAYWNKIPIIDPQNAIFDNPEYIDKEPKVALIYGTPRFINKGYPKEDMERFSAINKRISLPPKEERKEFYEKYCKRLAYLLNLYKFEKTYVVEPYFEYGIEKYPELVGRYFDFEMM